MHMTYRNCNDAFEDIVRGIYNGRIPTYPRKSGRETAQGDTLTIAEPLLITYEKPWERVLFNSARDVNPFFSMYESMWMLAGRNDVAPLAYYNSRIAEIASDDGKTFNGAYGYRWRKACYEFHSEVYDGDATSAETWETSTDQIKLIVDHLKRKPDSRRAVLRMWNVEDDLLRIDSSKDVCCNLEVMFALREERFICPTCNGNWTEETASKLDECPPSKGGVCPNCGGDPHNIFLPTRYIDMTVTNRSNDIIWGLLGANYVHFSFLQEYMAAQLGVRIGKYHHFSNNAHVYLNNWKPEEWLAASNNVEDYDYQVEPFVKQPHKFDEEIVRFVERHSKDAMAEPYSEDFLEFVAQPMVIAYHHYKRKEYGRALETAEGIGSEDWRVACRNWIERRKK